MCSKKPICKLTGENGNIFNLLAIVRKTLLNNGFYNESVEVVKKVQLSENYTEALQIISEYVEIV